MYLNAEEPETNLSKTYVAMYFSNIRSGPVFYRRSTVCLLKTSANYLNCYT